MATYFMAPAVNFLTKTLSGSLTDVATTITLSNTTNMLAPGYIVINRVNSSGTATPDNREVVYYTGISGSDLTGCTRGADGSTARAHADSSIVETMLTAGAWNSLTTITSTAIDSNGYLKAIASPVSIARMQMVQTAVTSIASIARAEVGTLVTGSYNPASLAVTSIASIAQLQVGSIAQPYDGWVTATDTWTYASASTFTIAGVDRTAVFTKGTRLKFTNSSLKYAVVVSSSFATNTTVTIAVNTDYVIANAAITGAYYSYEANPQGYPGWFSYTPTTTGWSSAPTIAGRYAIIGNQCNVYIHMTGGGTSNSTSFSVSLPATSAATFPITGAAGQAIDNGSSITTAILSYINPGSTSWSFFTNFAGAGWTASGAKYVQQSNAMYLI